jgi:hypothetical protein
MRLTWRDGVTTLLAGVVVATYAAYAAGWAIPVVDEVRGATLLIGIVGLAMCIVGGSGSTIASRNSFSVPASVLGGAALLLIITGLVTGWSLAVPLLAADTLVLWAISTARHAMAGTPTTQNV